MKGKTRYPTTFLLCSVQKNTNENLEKQQLNYKNKPSVQVDTYFWTLKLLQNVFIRVLGVVMQRFSSCGAQFVIIEFMFSILSIMSHRDLRI